MDTNQDNSYIDWKSWSLNKFGELSPSTRRYFRKKMRKAGVLAKQNIRVLEVGFGHGAFLTFARDLGWDVCGTEANGLLVAEAKVQGFSALQTENLSELPDNSFDLITAFDVLEHMTIQNIELFLSQVKNKLKDHGTFIARFPNGDSPFGLSYQNGDVTHITTLGSGKIRYFAGKLGVKMVYLGGEPEIILGKNIPETVVRTLSIIIKKLINLFVYFVFYPRKDFCSANLLFVFKKQP